MMYNDEVAMGLITPVEAALLAANDLLQRGEGTGEEVVELKVCLENLETMSLSEGEMQLLFETKRKLKRLPIMAAS